MHEMAGRATILTIPNLLTILRIFMIPVFVLVFYAEYPWSKMASAVIFALAGITDWIDGYLARKLNQVTPFGTFLDPISDKVFVGCLLVLLVGFGRLDGLWILPVLLILFREFMISGLREFLGPHDVKMPVTKLAKWKTTVQMLSLGLLILAPTIPYMLDIGRWSLALAALLTLITGWGYMKAGLDVIRKLS